MKPQTLRHLVTICIIVFGSARSASAAVTRVWNHGAGSSNWAGASNWNPVGVPQLGDSVFITATDSFAKTVVFDGLSFGVTNHFQQIFIDESGPGQITLLQADLELLAVDLNVGISGPGFYNMQGGTGIYGNATLGTAGGITIGPSAAMTPTVFRQIGGSLVCDGTMNCNTYIQTGGSITFDGTWTGVNFTQSGGSVFSSATMTLSGTYTYNSGVFGPISAAVGTVNAGTFIDNAGTFAGSVDTSHLVVNGSGTFLNGVTNRGALVVPAAQTIWAVDAFNQIGGSLVQSGRVGGALPGGIGSDVTDVTIGGGGTWTHFDGPLQGDDFVVGSGNGGTGIYTLSGGGSANFADISVGPLSNGSITQNAGLVLANGMTLGGFAGLVRGGIPAPGKQGFYTLNGGNLQVVGLTLAPKDSISGMFTQTGGVAQIGSLTANLDNTSTAIVNISGGSFSVATDSINSGSFTVSGGVASFASNLNGFGNVTVNGTGSLYLKRIRQNALALGGNGIVTLPTAGLGTIGQQASVSRLKSLNFDQAGSLILGTFDIGASKLVVDYDIVSPIANIRRYLFSGRNGGGWNGTGLTSASAAGDAAHHTAIGYAESSNFFGPSGGMYGDLLVDNTAVLMKLTRYGDADLDGDADGVDIGAWAVNFTGESGGTGTKVWSQGDWDYDGDVDGVDAGLWAQNFTGELGGGGLGSVVIENSDISPQAAAILRGMGITVVPEPVIGAAAVLIAISLRPRLRPMRPKAFRRQQLITAPN